MGSSLLELYHLVVYRVQDKKVPNKNCRFKHQLSQHELKCILSFNKIIFASYYFLYLIVNQLFLRIYFYKIRLFIKGN